MNRAKQREKEWKLLDLGTRTDFPKEIRETKRDQRSYLKRRELLMV